MTVRILLELQVEGDGETEQSIREHAAWATAQGEHSSAFHEVVGHLAMAKARQSWALADQYRQFELEHRARLARARERAARKDGTDD